MNVWISIFFSLSNYNFSRGDVNGFFVQLCLELYIVFTLSIVEYLTLYWDNKMHPKNQIVSNAWLFLHVYNYNI